MGFAAPVLTVVGAFASAAGAISGGDAAAAHAGRQADMANYQAQVARNNQIIAEQTADAEIVAGQRAAEMESLKTAAKVAKVKAAFGARGVDVSTGSALEVQASERELGKLDAETVLSNAQMRAYGYRSRAVSYGAQAGLYDAQGRAYRASGEDARTASRFRATSTLLSAASSLAGSAGSFGFGGGTGSHEDAHAAA